MRLDDMSLTDYLMAEYELKERQRKERMKQAEFEKYAKEHNLFICTKNILEQIRSEIEDLHSKSLYAYWTYDDLVELLDKYTNGESE